MYATLKSVVLFLFFVLSLLWRLPDRRVVRRFAHLPARAIHVRIPYAHICVGRANRAVTVRIVVTRRIEDMD